MPVYGYDTAGGRRWLFKVSVRNRQYMRRGFLSRREAREAETAFLAMEGKPRGVPLLSAVARSFLEVQSSQVKPSTLRAMEGKVSNYVLARLPDLPLDRYGYGVLSSWWEGVKACPLKGKNYVLGLLKALFRHGEVYFGVSNREPAKLLPYRDFTVGERRERRYLSLEDFRKVYALEGSPFFRLWLLLAFFTGMRISEMRGLQARCFDGERIHVFQQVQSKAGKGNVLTTPKTRSSVRSYHLPPFLRRAVKAHVEANGLRPDSFLFFARSPGDRGHLRPVSENTVNRELRRLSRESGIAFTSHSFRHGEATLLAAEGVGDEEIGRYLGHSSVEVTRSTYIHETEAERERISGLLEERFGREFS